MIATNINHDEEEFLKVRKQMEENKKFRQIEPTKIVYKPHCGNCGFPIYDEVAYQYIFEKLPDTMLANKTCTKVYPCRCVNCGALFNTIEVQMPEKLNDVFLGE